VMRSRRYWGQRRCRMEYIRVAIL